MKPVLLLLAGTWGTSALAALSVLPGAGRGAMSAGRALCRAALFGLGLPWQGALGIVGKEALFLTLQNAEQCSNICYFQTASQREHTLQGAWQAELKLCLVDRCSGRASGAGGKVWERLR